MTRVKNNKKDPVIHLKGAAKSCYPLKFSLVEPEAIELDDREDLDHYKLREDQYCEEDIETIDLDDAFNCNESDSFDENDKDNLYINNNYKLNADYIIIGCCIPNGLVIKVDGQTLLLRGICDMPGWNGLRSYDGIGFTKILRSIWNEFIKTHPNWPPLLNGSIFVSSRKEIWCDE